jgi:tetratricopeptide (TPR) repeat protein
MIRAAALLCALSAVPALAGAGSAARDLAAQGSEAYRNGRFPEAVDRYQRALREAPGSADLWFNLGNAYYRSGKSGQAAMCYEKALALDPHHEDARANLGIVHRRVGLEKARQELGLPNEGFWARLARRIAPDEVAIAFLALYYAFFGALVWRHFLRPGTARSLLGLSALLLFAVNVALGGFFAYRVYRQERVAEGVILEPKVSLMQPAAGSWKSVRSLPEALRVRILSRNEGWVEIRLPGGLSGYVREAQIGTL